MRDERWRQVKRALAVRLDSMGDVLLTTPAIRAIKETMPEAEVTLLASPIGAEVGKLTPGIDHVIVYQAPWMDVYQILPQDGERELLAIKVLRERQFDGAIIFTSYHQSPLPAAYMCYMAGIPLRHAATVDGAGSLLTTRHKYAVGVIHEVERGLELVGAIGFTTADKRIVLDIHADVYEQVSEMLAREGLSKSKPLAVVHPGCNFQARTYPWGSYVRVADLLARRLDCAVVFTGSKDETQLVERIRQWTNEPNISLAGKTSVAQLAALIGSANVVVTNNTGPMHLAAAMGTPVVALFALTNPPPQWRPWMVPHRLLNRPVPCAYCYNRVCPTGQECIASITPEEVVEAVASLLNV